MTKISLESQLSQIIHCVENLRTTDTQRDSSIDSIIEEIRNLLPLVGKEDQVIYARIEQLSPEIDRLASDPEYPGNMATRDTDPQIEVIEKIPDSRKRRIS